MAIIVSFMNYFGAHQINSSYTHYNKFEDIQLFVILSKAKDLGYE